MNKLILCLFLLFISLASFSQKVYFVYLQTENEQPFFVKINGNIRSSSASGYVILSKLHDSTYNFTVGFPKNKWPEQNFSVIVNKKDHGYLLKNFAEKGWGLFDLQTLTVQMSTATSAKIGDTQGDANKSVSAFTEILSKASGDPSLKEKTFRIKEESKPEIGKIAKKEDLQPQIKDTVVTRPEVTEQVVVKNEEPKIENKEKPVIIVEATNISVTEPFKLTAITKRSESSTTEGFGLVFIDNSANGISDTIRLLIPNPKPMAGVAETRQKEEKKFLNISTDITVENKNASIKTETKKRCAIVAEESDFFKLRKTMAAADGDEDMLNEAEKYFKTKCFSTEQLKNLSLLFLNDAAKYKFFELAYTYVTDAEKFQALQNQLKDEYYVNRFTAMLRN